MHIIECAKLCVCRLCTVNVCVDGVLLVDVKRDDSIIIFVNGIIRLLHVCNGYPVSYVII